MKELTAVELFAGAGGLGVGLERAGFKIMLANEIEKDFATTFQINHPHCRVLNEDIHSIDFKEEAQLAGVSKPMLLSGGPPCQGFSTVGSKNQKDPRNSLFYEYLRAVSELSPSYVLFENVSGFMRLYDGVAYKTLIGELESFGYRTVSGILEASDFGLPQKRQRTIVVGWLHRMPPVSFPSPTHFLEADIFGSPRKLTVMDAISDLPELGANDSKGEYLSDPQNAYQRLLRGDCQILTEHNSSNYGEKMREILSLVPSGGSIEDLPIRLRPKSYFKNTYARLVPSQPSPTITRNFGTPSSSRCIHPFQDRALSTREGARLQGFPDNYAFHGSKISKNLQIGNAVPPIFGEIIAQQIIKSIREERAS